MSSRYYGGGENELGAAFAACRCATQVRNGGAKFMVNILSNYVISFTRLGLVDATRNYYDNFCTLNLEAQILLETFLITLLSCYNFGWGQCWKDSFHHINNRM